MRYVKHDPRRLHAEQIGCVIVERSRKIAELLGHRDLNVAQHGYALKPGR